MSARTTIITITAAAALTLGAATEASAYATFFGEDLNNSATVPLSSTPSSTKAQEQFLAGFAGAGVETFEKQTLGAKAPLQLSFPGFDGDSVVATLSGGDGTIARVDPGTTDGAGRYSVPSPTTSQFWNVAAGPTGNFVVSFDREVTAFGFYGIDIGDFGGQLQLELLNGSTQVGLLTVNNTVGSNGSTDGSVLYFGLAAQKAGELFTSVHFLTTTGQADVFAFDNFTVAEPAPTVPVPATLPLVGSGLLALAWTIRRRRDGRPVDRSALSMQCH